MTESHPFRYCPRCAAGGLLFNGVNRFTCGACGFTFFQNTAAACGAILTVAGGSARGRIVLLRRGEEPSRGRLDYPGGFVEPGESAEDALRREIREEIVSEAYDLRLLCSQPNRYRYGGVDYPTCDLIFTGALAEAPVEFAEPEIAAIELVSPNDVRLDEIAFPSLREGMRIFLARRDADSRN